MDTKEGNSLRQRKIDPKDPTNHPSSGSISFTLQKTDIRATSDESDADGLIDGER